MPPPPSPWFCSPCVMCTNMDLSTWGNIVILCLQFFVYKLPLCTDNYDSTQNAKQSKSLYQHNTVSLRFISIPVKCIFVKGVKCVLTAHYPKLELTELWSEMCIAVLEYVWINRNLRSIVTTDFQSAAGLIVNVRLIVSYDH